MEAGQIDSQFAGLTWLLCQIDCKFGRLTGLLCEIDCRFSRLTGSRWAFAFLQPLFKVDISDRFLCCFTIQPLFVVGLAGFLKPQLVLHKYEVDDPLPASPILPHRQLYQLVGAIKHPDLR